MAMMLPGGSGGGKRQKPRGHGGHAAQAVNLDTGHHVDSRGNTHKTHPGNKAKIGPDTQIYAEGHPVMPFRHHAMNRTALHKRMMRRGNPHPNDLMAKAVPAMPGGNEAAPLMPGGMPMDMGSTGAPWAGLPGGRAG